MTDRSSCKPHAQDPDTVDGLSTTWHDSDDGIKLFDPFTCSFRVFREDYVPSEVTLEQVYECGEYLCQDSVLSDGTTQKAVLEEDGEEYRWKGCPWLSKTTDPEDDDDDARPCKRRKLDDTTAMPTRSIPDKDGKIESRVDPIRAYAPFFAIIRAIHSFGLRGSQKAHDVKQYPDECLATRGWGIAQGCIAEAEWDAEMAQKVAERVHDKTDTRRNFVNEAGEYYNVPTGRIVVPIACANKSELNVQRAVIATAHHAMRTDPRRMWMYGLVVEHHEVTLWLFTRTHTLAVKPINWIKNIWRFIRLILTVAAASPEKLGIDPLVHRISVDGSRQYVYECGDTSPVEPQPGPVFYKLVETLVEPPPTAPNWETNKTTRIQKVIQISSLNDPTPLVQDKFAVLKEVWMDAKMATESENQDRMFAAVDAFAARADWKSDGRLKDFDAHTLARLEDLFTDKKYQKLFLKKLHAWRGVKAAPMSEDVDYAPRFRVGPPPGWRLPNKLIPWPKHLHAAQQQARFVYEEICTPVHKLQTLGEVMDVIGQTLTALQILLCAGWVHRDVAHGNILAFRASENDPWAVKLADFEYAKALDEKDTVPGVDSGEHLIVGTNHFLPTEVSGCRYLFADLVISKRGAIPTQLKHEDTLAAQLHASDEAVSTVLSKFKKLDHFSCRPDIEDMALGGRLIPAETDVSQSLSEEWYKKLHFVVHNFQHDLESLWWVTMWILTHATGDECSRRYARMTTFGGDLGLTMYRLDVFMHGGPLWPGGPLAWGATNVGQNWWGLRPKLDAAFSGRVELLRKGMLQDMYLRPILGLLGVPSAYSRIHADFAKVYGELNGMEKKDWGKIKISFEDDEDEDD